MIDIIEFKGQIYPAFQAKGNSAKFCFPFAEQVCKGVGYDIGYSKPEWKFPGATGIDNHKSCSPNGIELSNTPLTALNLPEGEVDYIFNSHCLEHLPNWVEALDYWYEHLVKGGVMFSYVPHPDQIYWRPFNNRKHIHILHPADLHSYFLDKGYEKVFVSGRDLNHSYCVMCEK